VFKKKEAIVCGMACSNIPLMAVGKVLAGFNSQYNLQIKLKMYWPSSLFQHFKITGYGQLPPGFKCRFKI
jgi:hypothetical protein